MPGYNTLDATWNVALRRPASDVLAYQACTSQGRPYEDMECVALSRLAYEVLAYRARTNQGRPCEVTELMPDASLERESAFPYGKRPFTAGFMSKPMH